MLPSSGLQNVVFHAVKLDTFARTQLQHWGIHSHITKSGVVA